MHICNDDVKCSGMTWPYFTVHEGYAIWKCGRCLSGVHGKALCAQGIPPAWDSGIRVVSETRDTIKKGKRRNNDRRCGRNTAAAADTGTAATAPTPACGTAPATRCGLG